ncbi:hypothetical protein TNCV_1146841 [Trichonephila clavipes]|nr:hypothetical protein TNCV_1146841 [Trichonephila clavipes]
MLKGTLCGLAGLCIYCCRSCSPTHVEPISSEGWSLSATRVICQRPEWVERTRRNVPNAPQRYSPGRNPKTTSCLISISVLVGNFAMHEIYCI